MKKESQLQMVLQHLLGKSKESRKKLAEKSSLRMNKISMNSLK